QVCLARRDVGSPWQLTWRQQIKEVDKLCLHAGKAKLAAEPVFTLRCSVADELQDAACLQAIGEVHEIGSCSFVSQAHLDPQLRFCAQTPPALLACCFQCFTHLG